MSKEIKLTKGKYAIVDDEDFDFLNQWKWYYSEDGYAKRSQHIKLGFKKYKNLNIKMHRLVNNTPSELITDHINRNKLDNRRINLRDATKSLNGINRGKQKNNKSGYKGICWNKKAKKWIVEICIHSEKKYLGIFASLKEAIIIRKNAEKKYHEE